jgi:3-oxoacyl-[acyl-carrier protein] reductase
MDFGIDGKVAIVTGAGRYMGRAIALELASEGVRVGVNDLFAERAEAVAQEIRDRGGQAVAAVADVTDRTQVADMVQSVRSELGRIGILVNNAGLPPPIDESDTFSARSQDFSDADESSWARWVDVNYYGTLNCAKAVLPDMIEEQWGRIVSIISDAGRIGEPRQAVYAGAKAGIAGFSRSLAKEVGKHCITVNCVSLGSVLHEEWVKEWGDRAEDRIERMKRVYPMARGLDRLGLPGDAAFAVACFCCARAEWTTGQTVSVSGGYTMVP